MKNGELVLGDLIVSKMTSRLFFIIRSSYISKHLRNVTVFYDNQIFCFDIIYSHFYQNYTLIAELK